MFVLPNSTTATKRSSRKPKRFTSDESAMNDPEMDAIWGSKRRRGNRKRSEEQADKKQPELPPHIADEIQHVSIDIPRLPCEFEIEPWCMIHQLYKCHCKGKSQKGRPFTITIKKTASDSHGGWEVVSARKRQYTFEQDGLANARLATANASTENATNGQSELSDAIMDEPHVKSRKLGEQMESAARIRPIDRDILKQKSEHEIQNLRNSCEFAEKPFRGKLKNRIGVCRSYNKAQNLLTKSANSTLSLTSLWSEEMDEMPGPSNSLPKYPSLPDLPSTSNDSHWSDWDDSDKDAERHSNMSAESIDDSLAIRPTDNLSPTKVDRLNAVISNTMKRLATNQRLNKITINPTPSKLSFISWDRLLVAFKARQLSFWDVQLVDNERALIVTDDLKKPSGSRYLSVTDINHADINQLPMLAKLLLKDFSNEKTKYLGKFTKKQQKIFKSPGSSANMHFWFS